MARKASRSSIAKKAWKTRKANAKAAAGRLLSEKANPKPENKIITGLREALAMSIDEAGKWKVSENQVGPATISSLCTQIDDTLTALETRLTALNARINAIL